MASEIIKTTPFDYDEIYQELKTNMEDAGYDTADGSHTSMLTANMAYITSMLNANTAANINETILDFAQKRTNILTDARAIGYEPYHISSYVYNIIVTIPAGGITIPKGTEFYANGHTYYYLHDDIVVKESEEGDTIALRVKEGEYIKYSDDLENLEVVISTSFNADETITQYYIDIPYTNVEEDGLEVYCSYYDDFGYYVDHEFWRKSDSMILETDQGLIKKYIRQDNVEFGTPRIYLKYAGVGVGLEKGSVVDINVLISSGEDGGCDVTTPGAMTCALKDVKVKSIELVQEGHSEETNLSIKQNAPKIYNSANRLVTVNDYIAACERDTRVDKANVWGGEKEFPISPGHIWFSFYTVNADQGFASNDEHTRWDRNESTNYWRYAYTDESTLAAKQYYDFNYIQNGEIRCMEYNEDGSLKTPGIWDKLDEMHIPTLVYHHRHPIFCEFLYDIEIMSYLVSEDRATVHDALFDILYETFAGTEDSIHLESFNTEYFESSVIKRLAEKVTDISGFNLSTTNRLVLNSRVTCCEQGQADWRDIFIPLAIPYERYFDEDGYLMIDQLPNIDTPDFVQYLDEYGRDLFVDWTKIRQEIADKIPQEQYKCIVAPIKIKMSDETHEFTESDIESRSKTLTMHIRPDDFDNTTTYNQTVVKLIHLDEKSHEEITTLEMDKINGWHIGNEENIIVIGQGVNLEVGDRIYIYQEQICGFYYLFNSFRKEILVHLFVDGSHSGLEEYLRGDLSHLGNDYYIYTDDDFYIYTTTDHYITAESDLTGDETHLKVYDITPRSYLYTSDNMYWFTIDDYYITTEGYSLADVNATNVYSGAVVRKMSTKMYTQSPLKSDLFFRNRYLNLKYPSHNFATIKNVIPRLQKVEFKDVISNVSVN